LYVLKELFASSYYNRLIMAIKEKIYTKYLCFQLWMLYFLEKTKQLMAWLRVIVLGGLLSSMFREQIAYYNQTQ